MRLSSVMVSGTLFFSLSSSTLMKLQHGCMGHLNAYVPCRKENLNLGD